MILKYNIFSPFLHNFPLSSSPKNLDVPSMDGGHQALNNAKVLMDHLTPFRRNDPLGSDQSQKK